MQTVMTKAKESEMVWHVLDASDQVLGRISTKAAGLLMGKNKTCFAPHLDQGDGVIIINVEKIRVTGDKMKQKKYKRFSGYPGGLKEEPLEHLLARRPTEVLRHSIKGMLPKNRLGRLMIKRLKLYAGDKHPHTAQMPPVKAKKEKKESK